MSSVKCDLAKYVVTFSGESALRCRSNFEPRQPACFPFLFAFARLLSLVLLWPGERKGETGEET